MASDQTTQTKKGTGRKKILRGVIVSDKMKDTVVVLVNRYVQNPKYKKYQLSGKKYKAHDAGNTHHVGEKVAIEECRPISKDKRFKVL